MTLPVQREGEVGRGGGARNRKIDALAPYLVAPPLL